MGKIGYDTCHLTELVYDFIKSAEGTGARTVRPFSNNEIFEEATSIIKPHAHRMKNYRKNMKALKNMTVNFRRNFDDGSVASFANWYDSSGRYRMSITLFDRFLNVKKREKAESIIHHELTHMFQSVLIGDMVDFKANFSNEFEYAECWYETDAFVKQLYYLCVKKINKGVINSYEDLVRYIRLGSGYMDWFKTTSIMKKIERKIIKNIHANNLL